MIYKKNMLLISALGISAIVAGLAAHNHIMSVRAEKLEKVVPQAPYFPPGAPWNQDVSKAPLDPESSTIINWLAGAGGWGHNNRLQVDFDMRVMQADSTTPRVRIHKSGNWTSPDSDNVSEIPLPAKGGIEGQKDYKCDTGDDCHLLVVDRSAGKLYEAYQANLTNNSLTTSLVAVWDLNRVYPPSGRGEQCTSTDGAGFPIVPLLFNADELAAGHIDHAIRFILPNPRIREGVYVHPASHAGAPRGPDEAPPYGAHFRLKPSYDLSKLKPAAQVVARALQKYGMFLSDGGNIALTAENDADTVTKYADVNFGSHDLDDVKVTDFEVLDFGKPVKLTYDCVRNH